MSELLTSDIDRADALIDLSNIVRDRRLGGSGTADLIRLERVGDALGVLYGSAETLMYAVADDSLLISKHFPDRRQYSSLRRWADQGLIHVARKADPVLLELADATGLPIITRDRFVGHRREFPWLDGSDDAILEPLADRRGEVRLLHVTLQPTPDWQKSHHEEEDLIVQQGLRARPDLLTRRWACPEPRCPWHDPDTARFALVPRWKDGRLFCDLHGLDVVDRGPRPKIAQIKVMVDGHERHRFPVRENEQVIVGRGEEGVTLRPWLTESLRLQVSRVHLHFTLVGERLSVSDSSLNGSRLIRKDGSVMRLHAESAYFSVGDTLEIVPGIALARSGRRYPVELAVDRLPVSHTQPPEATILT